ncbi:MAG TPA: sensor histidine kinase N-terminal domain-containing protein [Burkholderiales bacterium]|nr:sensor histidine kinase N-terminal domain-containing protein [Burkholderiales bacterium]
MSRTDAKRNPSLLAEILNWMLVPLVLFWFLSMGIQYLLALSIAHARYDGELSVAVNRLLRLTTASHGRVQVALPAVAEAAIRGDEEGGLIYQVRASNGGVVFGSRVLAAPLRTSETEPGTVYFRDETVAGKPMRVGYMFATLPGREESVVVQVGETAEKRIALATAMIGGQLSIQFLLVPAALVLVWFGLSKGIVPLNELTARVRGRKPQDLSPLDPLDAPEEVRAFVYSINDLIARLAQSLQGQQRFVADAAHQLRTPIAGLKTQAELALRQRDRAGLELTMRQIAAGADRASRLINQLLALAQADSDTPPLMEPLDLNALALEATREWVPRAMEKRLDLGFEPAEARCEIQGNGVLLRELLNNVIDNAVRFTNSGGTITVRVLGREQALLEIEDSGVGISPAERELVFERFYRVLGSGSEGTGLGLAIVKAIADAHHAKVTLESNPKAPGTLVRVVFLRLAGAPHRLKRAA